MNDRRKFLQAILKTRVSLKKTEKGETFLTGKIRKERVMVLKNKRKETEKHPDYLVMIPTKDEAGSNEEI
jgi:hypothetical protein